MIAVGEKLLAAAREVSAYGLAAAHLGLDEPLVVISTSADANRRDYLLLYNPEVTAVATDTATGTEGSVSMPGIEVSVMRPIWADVAFDTPEGSCRTIRFESFVARVAQHEIDQMNGLFFLARVSRLKRDAAIRRFGKTAARCVSPTGPIS